MCIRVWFHFVPRRPFVSFIAQPCPGLFKRVAQAGDELGAIGMTIDRKAPFRRADKRHISARQYVIAKAALGIEKVHAARVQSPAFCRATSSSARRSARGGILSSRSIIVASDPKRAQAFL